MDWKKLLIPLIVTAALTVTSTIYGISILPRINGNERGIQYLIELVMELKEDVADIKATLREHTYDKGSQDSSDRSYDARCGTKVRM